MKKTILATLALLFSTQVYAKQCLNELQDAVTADASKDIASVSGEAIQHSELSVLWLGGAAGGNGDDLRLYFEARVWTRTESYKDFYSNYQISQRNFENCIDAKKSIQLVKRKVLSGEEATKQKQEDNFVIFKQMNK